MIPYQTIRVLFTLMCTLILAAGSAQDLQVTGTTPSPNSNHANTDVVIQVSFDAATDAASITSGTFQVSGDMTGMIQGSFSGAGSNQVTFTPGAPLVNGEVINVTLTTGITASGNSLAESYSFRFTVVTGPAASGSVSFEERIQQTSQQQPWDVKAGDIDGDGDIDMLVAWATDDAIIWYENNGQLAFTEHVVGTQADGISGVHLADVNRDGHMDLLSASQSDNKISWYENNGSASFTERVISTAANRAATVYVADMEGDGDMDVVGGGFVPVSTPTPRLLWFENDGDENFTEHEITGYNLNPTDIHPADVDEDGDMDLLISSENQSFGAGENKLVWLENDGSNTFSEHIIDDTQQFYANVFGTDLDDDGDLDVVYCTLLNKLGWYENDGNENFTDHEIGSQVSQPRDLHVGDVDGDGDMDVLHVAELEDKIAWYENDGNENFTERIIFDYDDPTGENNLFPWALTAADIDQDGDLDVLGTFRFAGRLSVFVNGLIGGENPEPGAGLIIYNGVSTRVNGKNDYFRIENIEDYPGNRVEIFNRWGQKVYEITEYQNQSSSSRFEGTANVGGSNELLSGTYFYVISAGEQTYTGYLHLRR